jgi:hypothetical protein
VASNEQLHLEELLAAAANDPARTPAFLRLLIESTVLVPGVPNPDDPTGRSVNLSELTNPAGKKAQPFYTSEERLQDTVTAVPGFESHYFALRCHDLFTMTRGATLILNPHSAAGKEFLPAEIANLLDPVPGGPTSA